MPLLIHPCYLLRRKGKSVGGGNASGSGSDGSGSEGDWVLYIFSCDYSVPFLYIEQYAFVCAD